MTSPAGPSEEQVREFAVASIRDVYEVLNGHGAHAGHTQAQRAGEVACSCGAVVTGYLPRWRSGDCRGDC